MYMQTGLIVALVAMALGVAIVMRSPQNRLYQIFAVICGSVALIHLSLGLSVFTQHIFWERSKFLGMGFLIPSLLIFFGRFPDELKIRSRLEFIGWQIVSLLLILSAFFPQPYLSWKPGFLYFPIYGLLTQAILISAMFRALQQLVQQYHQTTDPIRQGRLKILLVASVLTIAGLLLQKIPHVPPLGSIAVVIFLYFLYQALINYRLMDLKEILGRGIVFTIQALILTLIFWTLLSLAEVGISPTNAPSRPQMQYFLFNAFVSVTIIIILYEPLRKLIENTAQRIFFRRHFLFEHRIQNIRDNLPSKVNPDDAIRYLLKSLEFSGRVSNASIYIFEEEFQVFRLQGEFGQKNPLPNILSNAHSVEKMQKLAKKPTALILENLQRDLEATKEKEKTSELIRTLVLLDAQVTLPMVTSSGLFMGIFNLKDQSVEEGYSNSEIRILMTLAGQLATVLRSLQLYNQIIEKDRLLQLGEMAAGLAHEIRNPLGAIKGAAQFLTTDKTPAKNKEKKFLKIIVEESDRLNGVLEDFLDFARSEKRPQPPGDVNQLLLHTVKLVSTNGMPKKVRLDLDLQENLPLIPMNAERLKQVFLNLAMNSIQSMPRGGTLHISSKALDPNQVEICFSDTGVGIEERDIDKVFAPFYTTRPNGSGLGLSICQRIISDHNGEIRAESKGKHGGARFRIHLNTEQSGESKT